MGELCLNRAISSSKLGSSSLMYADIYAHIYVASATWHGWAASPPSCRRWSALAYRLSGVRFADAPRGRWRAGVFDKPRATPKGNTLLTYELWSVWPSNQKRRVLELFYRAF
jgi:hypothetical protein